MVTLGASDAPVVLGVSPHKTPWELWATLVGLIPKDEYESEIMRAGSDHEGAVLDTFLREMGWSKRAFVRSPETRAFDGPYRATPDALVFYDVNCTAIVEVKCIVHHVPSSPRVDWLVQCLHQRMVTEKVAVSQAVKQYLVAFGGLTTTWWEIPYHQAAIDRVRREEEAFLELVEKEIPPPVSARDASALNRAWPLTRKEPKRLSPNVALWDAEYQHALRNIAVYEKLRDHAVANIKAELGDSEEGVMLDNKTRYTWKWHERQAKVVKGSSYRQFQRIGTPSQPKEGD